MEEEVKVGQLTAQEFMSLKRVLQHAERYGSKFLVAFDETDQSIKWKVGEGVWSPPVRTEER